MVKMRIVLAVLVALIVVGAAWWLVNDSSLRIVTQDVNYEATFDLNNADGTTTEVKRYQTASVRHDNKIVDSVTFNLDAKFKAAQGDDVRLLSPRAGGEHETKLTFYACDVIFGEFLILEYPLSASTNTDYSLLDTGDWYHIFVDKKVTMKEVSDARDGELGFKFSLKAVVDIWYNMDPKKNELVHHELTFKVPFSVDPKYTLTPDPDEYVSPGDPDYSGILDPDDTPVSVGIPVVGYTINDPITITTNQALWLRTENQDLSFFKNLDKS